MDRNSSNEEQIDLEKLTKNFKVPDKETFVSYLKEIWVVRKRILSLLGFIPKK